MSTFWQQTDDPVELGLRAVSIATSALMAANNDDNLHFHDGMQALRALSELFTSLRSLHVVASVRARTPE